MPSVTLGSGFDNDSGLSTFSPAFVGQTANALVGNLDVFNSWTDRVWNGTEESAAAAVGEVLSDRKALPSAGTSYPTMLMYLRSPETAAVWLRITDRGLQRLTSYKPTKNPGNGGPADYAAFCKAAEGLMADYDVPPELLDYLLAAAGRADESKDTAPSSAGVWLFQANPSIYDIVDEINRGNIPKIFGELLFLLEYRQKAGRLQYWPDEQFSLPRNLFLIGTMNTADRSKRTRSWRCPSVAATPPRRSNAPSAHASGPSHPNLSPGTCRSVRNQNSITPSTCERPGHPHLCGASWRMATRPARASREARARILYPAVAVGQRDRNDH